MIIKTILKLKQIKVTETSQNNLFVNSEGHAYLSFIPKKGKSIKFDQRKSFLLRHNEISKLMNIQFNEQKAQNYGKLKLNILTNQPLSLIQFRNLVQNVIDKPDKEINCLKGIKLFKNKSFNISIILKHKSISQVKYLLQKADQTENQEGYNVGIDMNLHDFVAYQYLFQSIYPNMTGLYQHMEDMQFVDEHKN